MRALITGITGFIGSHVAELLLDRGQPVLGTTRDGWRLCAPRRLREVSLVRWDIVEPPDSELLQAIEQFAPDTVFHFAGRSIPSQCGTEEPTDEAREVNIGGTSRVLELVRSLDTAPRLIFASTCHVYRRVSPNAPYVDESAEIDPISAYGITKLQSEQLILDYVSRGQLDACIARGFQHVGPRQPRGLMLSDWFEQLTDTGLPRVTVKCLNSFLDMVDVRDAAQAYLLLAEAGVTGEVYNLGSGKVSRSGDVLEMLMACLKRRVAVTELRDEHQWNAIADIGRLSALGWRPKIDIERTLADMNAIHNSDLD